MKTSGRYDEAVEAYRAVLAGHPRYGEAWYSLANLKVYSFADDDIGRMQSAESSGSCRQTIPLGAIASRTFRIRVEYSSHSQSCAVLEMQ